MKLHPHILLPWFGSMLALVLGVRLILADAFNEDSLSSLNTRREQEILRRVCAALMEMEEMLTSGVVPPADRWERLRTLPPPWGTLTYESLEDLRRQGGALLPTLKRLRALAEEHFATLGQARARSAQAVGQAIVCTVLVPIFGSVLYLLLPGMSNHPYAWLGACAGALILASIGGAWLLRLSVDARWAGLQGERKKWAITAQCAGERFLALVRCGNPPDTAWVKMSEFLARESQELAEAWGALLWGAVQRRGVSDTAAQPILNAGEEIKKAVQISMMEGRACGERVETSLLALRQDLHAQTERELSLLPSRALKPLFIFLAPSIMGLLVFGLWITWSDSVQVF